MSLGKIISLFIVFTCRRHILAGINSTEFKSTHALQYYTEPARLRRKYAKLFKDADVLQQIICNIKAGRDLTRHDNVNFRPIVTKTAEISPLLVDVDDKGYDSEDKHILVREKLHAFSVMPTRYENVLIWRTHGRYRK